MLQKYHNIYVLWYIYNAKSVDFIMIVILLTHKKIITYMWVKIRTKQEQIISVW